VPIVVGTEVTPPTVKPDEKEKAVLQQLDLVFTMDCTGSMGSYISAAKKNIEAIVEKLVKSEGYDLRFALIAYRDHPPQDQSYVTKKFAFTADIAQMKRDLATLSAQGGGDGPEAVAAGLHETLHSDWRPSATKVCVLIADAPPHGLGEPGDGFPDGAPDGVDPFAVLTQMSMRGICIYSVGCEPALSGYQHAKDFFVAAAQKTNGQAVSLRSAAALADVIMGGAIEEMDLQQLADEVVEEVRQMRAARGAAAGGGGADDGYDSEEERTTAWQSIQSRGHTTRHMQTKKLKSRNAGAVCKAASLAEARETLKLSAPPAPPRFRAACSAFARKSAAAPPPPGAVALSRKKGITTRYAAEIGASADEATRSNFDMEFRGDGFGGSDSGDSDDETEGSAGAATGGVRLETRALSFSQMSRIYGRQKKMGVL